MSIVLVTRNERIRTRRRRNDLNEDERTFEADGASGWSLCHDDDEDGDEVENERLRVIDIRGFFKSLEQRSDWVRTSVVIAGRNTDEFESTIGSSENGILSQIVSFSDEH